LVNIELKMLFRISSGNEKKVCSRIEESWKVSLPEVMPLTWTRRRQQRREDEAGWHEHIRQEGWTMRGRILIYIGRCRTEGTNSLIPTMCEMAQFIRKMCSEENGRKRVKQ
jgi:hypothetical protein